LPTIFNHGHLNNYCEYGDAQEQWISEDSSKDVELSLFEQSCVELIEHLHEDKSLEDEGKQESFLGEKTFCALLVTIFFQNLITV